jgi:hypothetical protein
MSVYKKLNAARVLLQNTKLSKSGYNKFANYSYFELGDFLPTINNIFNDVGIFGVISYGVEIATLEIFDVDDDSKITITSPMAEANLKGTHPIQNLGAVQTYLRRYLWVTALEIVEHDAIEPLTNPNDKPVAKAKEKQQITDERLKAAIVKIKAKEYTVEQLTANFELTSEQDKTVLEALLG